MKTKIPRKFREMCEQRGKEGIALQNQNELKELVNSVTGASDAPEKEDELVELLDTAGKPAPPAPPAQDAHKQKMAQIREALAMANHDDTSGEPSVRPSQHEALPPLKRKTASAGAAAPKASAQKAPAPQEKSAPQGKSAPKAKPMPALKRNPAAERPGKQVPAKHAPKPEKKKHALKNPFAKLSGGAKLPTSVYVGSISGAVVLAAIIGYFIVAATYQGKFLPNTMVDNIDLSGMNAQEAACTLLNQKAVPDLRLTTPKGDTAVFSAADFNAKYHVPDGAFEDAAQENPFAWIVKLFKPSEYTVNYYMTYTEWRLRELIDDYDWGNAESENAVVVMNDAGQFVVQPETLGDQFDTQTLLNYIKEQVAEGKTTINMEDSGCYESYRAEVKAVDLEKELDLYNNYAKCTITYTFGDYKDYVVNSDMIVDWIMLDDNGAVQKNDEGQIIFDYNAISQFVAEMAADTDTWGKPHEFQSTVDGLITVPWTGHPYSTYGWQINQESTAYQLIDLLRAGKTVSVEPEYAHRGYCRGKNNDDIGNTYIDVEISEQHAWVYIDGECVFECDFVSGTETNPGRRTPRGVCQIMYKARNVTLGTYAVQGYEAPVSFWMPFNDWGCGFHDLSRGAYGGQIYMYNGSHGCLNLSWGNAQTMYDTVEQGMPCMVHD